MRNLGLAAAIGIVVFVAVGAVLPAFWEGSLPGLIAFFAAYWLLARRTMKKVESIFMEVAKTLQTPPPRFELAVNTLEKAYTYAVWQFGVRSQVDGQIGQIYFLQQENKKAQPYLERSTNLFGHWMGGAMLGVIHYKRKDHAAMRRVMDETTKRAKTEALAWCLYAYLLVQIGDRDAAQKVLATGLEKTKQDTRVKDALLAVQNNKKLKMSVFKEQWYMFRLENPPPQQPMFMPGGRMSKQDRRGRW
jgi:hypothetical protein